MDPNEAERIQEAIYEHVKRSLSPANKCKQVDLHEIVLTTLATLYLFGITGIHAEE